MLPRVIMSNGISIDGRIDGFAADLGLYYGLTATWKADAHLVGSNTLLKSGAVGEEGAAEVPLEPPHRDPADRRALLVVPDSRGRIRNWHGLRRQPFWRDIVVLIARDTPGPYRDYLRRTEVDFVEAGTDRVDMCEALIALNERYGVQTVHLDSGGILNGVMLHAGLVNEINLLVHPEMVGGATPNTIFAGPGALGLEQSIKARLLHVEAIGEGLVWLRYEVLSSTATA